MFGWLRGVFNAPVEKAGTKNPPQWFVDWLTGGKTSSGKNVGPGTAMQAPTVAACIRVVREDVAKVPLILYRRAGKGRERATDHRLYGLLHDSPNPDAKLTSFEWREWAQDRLERYGNAYSRIVRDARGQIVALVPWEPDDTIVKRAVDDDMLFYEHTGRRETVSMADMLHLRGPLDDSGVMGKSAVRVMRETIGMELMAEENQGKLLKNGQRPPGILVHPAGLSETAEKNIRESWEKQTNAENRGKTAILEEGMKYIQVGMNNDDAQALEGRKLTRSQIAAGWRIPPHKIGDLDKATFSNIEHQALEYVVDSLMPRLGRFESCLNLSLLTAAERAQGYYFEFLVDGLLRGDIKTRFEAYAIAVQNLALTPNEWRARENMNPVPWGDDPVRTPNNSAPEPAPADVQEPADA